MIKCQTRNAGGFPDRVGRSRTHSRLGRRVASEFARCRSKYRLRLMLRRTDATPRKHRAQTKESSARILECFISGLRVQHANSFRRRRLLCRKKVVIPGRVTHSFAATAKMTPNQFFSEILVPILSLSETKSP